MPMPPPKPATEGRRDRQVFHEIRQIVRALEHLGPTPVEGLRSAVGAQYWEKDRFDRALVIAVADGLVHRRPDGALVASG